MRIVAETDRRVRAGAGPVGDITPLLGALPDSGGTALPSALRGRDRTARLFGADEDVGLPPQGLLAFLFCFMKEVDYSI